MEVRIRKAHKSRNARKVHKRKKRGRRERRKLNKLINRFDRKPKELEDKVIKPMDGQLWDQMLLFSL